MPTFAKDFEAAVNTEVAWVSLPYYRLITRRTFAAQVMSQRSVLRCSVWVRHKSPATKSANKAAKNKHEKTRG